ncbi:MAG: 2-oxo acid dehydrogenase subunit E2 [Bacteroidales bacterium]
MSWLSNRCTSMQSGHDFESHPDFKTLCAPRAFFAPLREAKKNLVINDQITIMEVLSMTILMDHDVIDGAMMASFISDLTKNIESGLGL